MSKRHRARFVALVDLLARLRPDVDLDAITDGRVLVDGRVLTNPRARVRADVSLRVAPEPRLRGTIKLTHAHDEVLVKPTFELGRGALAATDSDVIAATRRAVAGIVASGWTVVETCDAPRTGHRGAREAFVHARRARTHVSGEA